MTIDDPILKAHHDALAFFEDALRRAYMNRDKYHPTQYRAMVAEPLVDEICKIRAEIDKYIGLTEFTTSSQVRNPISGVPETTMSHESSTTNGSPTPAVPPQGAPAPVTDQP
jgi:hypothetical protein